MVKSLVYTISPHNGSVVFASLERAQLVDRINRAIDCSSTWAEFRKAMPKAEYSSIVGRFDDVGEPRRKGSDGFSASQLPGFDEGDYPPWLQAEMESVLPPSFFARFAVRDTSFTSGGFWTIPRANLAEALDALAGRGYEVTKAVDLKFW